MEHCFVRKNRFAKLVSIRERHIQVSEGLWKGYIMRENYCLLECQGLCSVDWTLDWLGAHPGTSSRHSGKPSTRLPSDLPSKGCPNSVCFPSLSPPAGSTWDSWLGSKRSALIFAQADCLVLLRTASWPASNRSFAPCLGELLWSVSALTILAQS